MTVLAVVVLLVLIWKVVLLVISWRLAQEDALERARLDGIVAAHTTRLQAEVAADLERLHQDAENRLSWMRYRIAIEEYQRRVENRA